LGAADEKSGLAPLLRTCTGVHILSATSVALSLLGLQYAQSSDVNKLHNLHNAVSISSLLPAMS
jgi:hypothetical protein